MLQINIKHEIIARKEADKSISRNASLIPADYTNPSALAKQAIPALLCLLFSYSLAPARGFQGSDFSGGVWMVRPLAKALPLARRHVLHHTQTYHHLLLLLLTLMLLQHSGAFIQHHTMPNVFQH